MKLLWKPFQIKRYGALVLMIAIVLLSSPYAYARGEGGGGGHFGGPIGGGAFGGGGISRGGTGPGSASGAGASFHAPGQTVASESVPPSSRVASARDGLLLKRRGLDGLPFGYGWGYGDYGGWGYDSSANGYDQSAYNADEQNELQQHDQYIKEEDQRRANMTGASTVKNYSPSSAGMIAGKHWRWD